MKEDITIGDCATKALECVVLVAILVGLIIFGYVILIYNTILFITYLICVIFMYFSLFGEMSECVVYTKHEGGKRKPRPRRVK